ncbi:MAG: hypothetical protein LBV63_02035 [Candidatus Methanoplasma sp.]|jgi:predicted transglutaminase-like cysteine proteinase|nr:hypothetical protein [Candidatus Methanoplasma sp.]
MGASKVLAVVIIVAIAAVAFIYWTPAEKEMVQEETTYCSLNLIVDGDGVVDGNYGKYFPGDIATLKAIPASNSEFVGWYVDGKVLSTDLRLILNLDDDRDVTARFSALQRGSDKIVVVEGPAPGTAHGEGDYRAGETTEVSAVPGDGYGFDGWYFDGVRISDDEKTRILIPEDGHLEARFDPLAYDLNVTVSSNAIFAPGSISGAGEYRYGTFAQLKATSYPGYLFDGWYIDGSKISSHNNLEYQVTGDKRIEAKFGIDHNSAFAVGGTSAYAPSTLTASGTTNSEITKTTWTITDILAKKQIASFDSEDMTYLFALPVGIDIARTVTYSDGYTETSTERTITDGVKKIHYEWGYQEEEWYSGVLHINNRFATLDESYRFSDYFAYASKDVKRYGIGYAVGADTYVTYKDPMIVDITEHMASATEGMSQLQRAQYVSNFVQSAIAYKEDIVGKGQTEYYSFPYETLYDQFGDCEDNSILYVSIMKGLGYDMGLLTLTYTNSGHMVPLAVIDGATGFTYEYGGKTYVACEVTADPAFFNLFNKSIGELPNGYEESAKLAFYAIGKSA